MALAALLVIALAVTAAAILSARPWRLAIAMRAEGRPDGSWAVAGGVQGIGCSASVAAARGVEPVVDLRVLGRRVFPDAARRRAGGAGPKRSLDGWRRGHRRLARWIDPLDLAAFLLEESRRIAVRDLEGSVRFGLHDVALAGEISGVLAAISALAAPFGRFDHEVDWTMREHLDASLSLTLRFTPAWIAWDCLRFVVRSIRVLPRSRAPAARLPNLHKTPAPQH
jgi:hypothetical protein